MTNSLFGKGFFALTVVAVFGLLRLINLGDFESGGAITSDGRAYYAYLPAWFVYHSPDFHFYDQLELEAQQQYWLYEGPEEGYFPKMTMGVAYLMTPAFVVAHAVAHLFGFETDGWSLPYQLAIALNTFWFTILGLWALHRWLRLRFSSSSSSLVVLLLFFATQLYHYSSAESAISHCYSFALLCFFLLGFEGWRMRPQILSTIVLGFIAGVIVLIRPTNIVLLLVPFGWLLASGELYKGHIKHIVCMVVCALFPIVPQLMFWHHVSGEWFFYSYGEERIFWSFKHILDGLFSFRNGWLMYTPVMWLALLGLLPALKVNRNYTWWIVGAIGLHLFTVFSWWCWYYGDSFSIRPMIDAYPLLALPLAASISWLLARKDWVVLCSMALFGLLIGHNVIFSDLYHGGQLSGSRMTKEAYAILMFNPNPPPHLSEIGAYEEPDTDRLRRGEQERTIRDTNILAVLADLEATQLLSGPDDYSEYLEKEVTDYRTKEDKWLVLECEVRLPCESSARPRLNLTFNSSDGMEGYHAVWLEEVVSCGTWQSQKLWVRKPAEDKPLMASGGLWLQDGVGVELRKLRLMWVDTPYVESL